VLEQYDKNGNHCDESRKKRGLFRISDDKLMQSAVQRRMVTQEAAKRQIEQDNYQADGTVLF